VESILVTGGAGFIGSHLVERLLADGRAVTVLDNFDPFYDKAVKRRNLARAEGHPAFRFVEGDIRDERVLAELFAARGFTALVHLAARAGVRPSIADPAGYADVNVNGTVRLFEACRRHGVERIVFASSSSVYGDNEKVPFSEEDRVDHPVSPYAATKKAGELLAHTHCHLFGASIACLRYFTVFGPRQRPEMAIHAFTRLLADGKPVPLFGDGSSERDYTYIDDIVDGTVRALDKVQGFRVYNLGGSRTTALRDLVAKLAAGLRVEARIETRPFSPGDVARTWADVRRASAELGWTPKIDLDRGIARFLEWFARERSRAGHSAGER